MSHWEKVKSEITELDVLESAATELGATCLRNALARGWSRQGRGTAATTDKMADLVIQIPGGKYDIAVTLNKETGVYEMEADWFDGSVAGFFQKEGNRLGKLLEMYSVHRAENLCRKQRKKFKRVNKGTHTNVEVFV